jgi:hypothetical protein
LIGGLRSLRAWLTTATLVVISLGVALLASPTAFAGLRQESAVGATSVTPTTEPAPMMLASTGLDITVPIIIGLSVLVLGTVMVGWAFLATGRRSQQR